MTRAWAETPPKLNTGYWQQYSVLLSCARFNAIAWKICSGLSKAWAPGLISTSETIFPGCPQAFGKRHLHVKLTRILFCIALKFTLNNISSPFPLPSFCPSFMLFHMDLPLPVLVLYSHLLILSFFHHPNTIMLISLFFNTCTSHVHIPHQHGFFHI